MRFKKYQQLSEWFRQWMRVNNKRPETIKEYLFQLRYFENWLTSETDVEDIEDIESKHIQSFATMLYDLKRSTATIHAKMSALKTFFKALYRENKIYVDLTEHIVLPRKGKKAPSCYLTLKEAQQVFNYLEEKTNSIQGITFDNALMIRDRSVIEIAYSTGCRKSEIVSLKLTDILWAEGLIYVNERKGGDNDLVPVGKTALAALKRYILEARPFLLQENDSEYLFINRFGNHISGEAVRMLVKKHIKDAGIEHSMTVHGLRHSFASHFLKASGGKLRHLQLLLGHKDISSTQVYTHIEKDELKKAHEQYHLREQDGFMDDNIEDGECGAVA